MKGIKWVGKQNLLTLVIWIKMTKLMEKKQKELKLQCRGEPREFGPVAEIELTGPGRNPGRSFATVCPIG